MKQNISPVVAVIITVGVIAVVALVVWKFTGAKGTPSAESGQPTPEMKQMMAQPPAPSQETQSPGG
ncbi:MAG: hypothetical protein ACUVX8_04255 [Candidatus Zipacnadales bacterium]